MHRRHAGSVAPQSILCPYTRKIEPTSNRGGNFSITDDHFYTNLTIALLTHRAAILMSYSNRFFTLLEPPGLIHDPS